MTWAASARMYAVAPGASEAWRALLTEVGRRSGVALEVVEHAFPASLADLWRRPDLGCAFMCGWPLAREAQARAEAGEAPRPVLAAPVPDAPWSAGRAIYRSDFVVAAKSSFSTLPDTFGKRFALNALHSHSGANMPRAHLARWAASTPLFSEMVGPLTTPRRCIEAVAAGAAEVTAIDSYALQLLRRHDPDLAAAIRVIDSSEPNPIPPLVAASALPPADQARLGQALATLHEDAAGRALLAPLCLMRFEPADLSAYEATLTVESRAQAGGYPALR